MPLAWVWAWDVQLQHFGAEFPVGHVGRTNGTETLAVKRDET